MFGRMNIYVYDCGDGEGFFGRKSHHPQVIGELVNGMVGMVGWR